MRKNEAFIYTYIGCSLQEDRSFINSAKSFFKIQDPAAFSSGSPWNNKLDTLRRKECVSCKASLNFNHGMGFDCWCSIPLPLGEEVYDLISSQLNTHIKTLSRDINISDKVFKALSEVSICENATLGGVQSGWLVDSKLLHERVQISSPFGSQDVSVASIVGYFMRDGILITQPRLLSEIFNFSIVNRYSPESPIIALASIFQTAVVSNAPVKVNILKVQE